MNYNFYVIWNKKLPDYIYIGCTINDLETRLNQHISRSKKYKNRTLYNFINSSNGGWNNFNIELIDYHYCNDIRDANYIEQFYINEFDSTLNSQNSYRTHEELKIYNTNNYKLNYNKEKYIKNNCKLCNKNIWNTSKYCFQCNNLNKRKVKNRPNIDILMNDLKKLKTYVLVGKKYNVSDNTIRKWINNLRVVGSIPTRGF